MGSFQLLVGLMAIAILLVGIAQKLRLPYPIILVIGGAILGFIPGLPPVYFDPNLILVVVLPPILYYAAFWISFREFKERLRDILSLALGLVVATTVFVGLSFKWLFPDLPWALAFVFGATVSPPDAASATVILKRFTIRSSLLTTLEGESLINDASALVLYRLGVAALLSGVFSLSEGMLEFGRITLGGICVGLISGFILQRFSRRFLDPIVGVVFSFTMPYIVYISADLIGVSGVLAVVINGLIGARILIKHHSSLRRVVGYSSWDIFVILLNCFVFILIGSQLRIVTEGMTAEEMVRYTGYGIFFTIVLIAVRMAWVYAKQGIDYIRASRQPKKVAQCPMILRDAALLGWSGMRGIVSLAAALALPETLPDGMPLPGREVVIFITFIVILLTLIIPGLTLPTVIRWLKIHHCPDSDSSTSHTRKLLVKAAEDEIQRLFSQGKLSEEDRIFLSMYINARHRIWEMAQPPLESNPHQLELARQKVLQAQRTCLLQIWERGELDDRLLGMLERELDVEETHFTRALLT